MKRIATYRDISVIQNDPFIVIATDSSGSIGEKEHDSLPVQIEMAAAYCLRVCLVELTAVGAKPEIIISTVSNEFEPTGRKILDEIKRQCERYRITEYDISGSSEENFATGMTGFGITVVGSTRQLHWKQTRIGDFCYLYGMPYLGHQVLDHEDALLDPTIIQTLFSQYEINDLLPCGSSGIQKELNVLCSEMNLSFECRQNIDSNLLVKSAGPATCGIFSSSQIISRDHIQLLGHFIKRAD
ncbi:MAG TPA: hypothetical protein P5107_12625 [Thermotogota bacterium]|nr:hypothetical protein [Thermotogota bacterium]HRW35887.1 hypothetical protein [Thermotogota bacterium]